MNLTLADYLAALAPYWGIGIPGLIFVVHEVVAFLWPRYRRWLEEHIALAWRLLILLLVVLVSFFWASFFLWKHDQEKIATKTSCFPKVVWQESRYQFDEVRKLHRLTAIFLITRQSNRDYGVHFETRGGSGQGIWARTGKKRRPEFMKKDVERIQLQPEGMAHFLYMPEGVVEVAVWSINPTKVTFPYRAECFG